MLPAHSLDLQSVESHPGVLTGSEQTQRLLHLVTGSAERGFSNPMSGVRAMSTNYLNSNNDLLLSPVDSTSRVGRIQAAFLVELNLSPEIIRQIVLVLRRHNV